MALHISILPNELLFKIFSHISTQDLILNVSNVCVHWKNLTKDPATWKQRIFVCDRVDRVDDILRILPQSPLLCEFHMRNRRSQDEVTKILSALFHLCRVLHTLVFEKVTVDTYTTIKDSIKNLKDLQVLILNSNIALVDSEKSCRSLCEAFEKPTKLRKLIVPPAIHLNGTHLRLIAENCNFLEELAITGARRVSDSDMIYFIEKRKDTLVVLKISGYNLTDNFFSKLRICTKLRTLAICDCRSMSTTSIWSIGELHLKSLSLYWMQFSSSHMTKFFTEGNVAGLLELDLSLSPAVDDHVTEAISVNCIILQSLSLSGCRRVSDTGVKMILNGCKALRNLRLSNMLFLTGDFLHFVPVLGLSLRFLSVDKHLKSKLPQDQDFFRKVKIEWC